MIATSWIQVAIWTYFTLSQSANTHFDLAASRHVARCDQAKVVLRETSISEECGLGVEAVVRPDKEIAALQADASRLSSVLGIFCREPKPASKNLGLGERKINWEKQFAVQWDDDGEVRFGGKPLPNETNQSGVITFSTGFWR